MEFKSLLVIIIFVILSTALGTSGHFPQTVLAQVNGTGTSLNASTEVQGFSSAFDTCVTSTSSYGVYD